MNNKEFREKYEKKTYLGDGLYVYFDGFNICLTTERENGEHWVGLEPSIFDELVKHVHQLYEDAKSIER